MLIVNITEFLCSVLSQLYILCVSFGLNSQERYHNGLYLIPRWVPLGSRVHVALSMWPEGPDHLHYV